MLAAAWIAVEWRQREPLVDMRLMRDPTVFATNLAALMVGFGMFGSFILIPQLVQLPESTGFGFGATVTHAGLVLLPSSFVMLFAGPVAGWLGGRFGAKLPLLIGTAVATVAFGTLAVEHGRLAVYACTTLMRLGIGFSSAAMANLIVEAVPQGQTGVATGINTIMRSIGGQIAATIVAGHLLVHQRAPRGVRVHPGVRDLRHRGGAGLPGDARDSRPARLRPPRPPGRRADGKLPRPP